MTLRHRFHGITDVGRKRDHNEDAYYVTDEGHFGILADGMGGRHFGEVAANMTVDLLRGKFEAYFPPSYERLREADQANVADMVVCLLDEWVRDVNFRVWQKGQEDSQYREMGTTVVAAYALPNITVLAHVGDSRAYLFRDGALTLVTRDHSLVNSQIDCGMITEEEAATSNQRNIITRAIGTAKDVKPDVSTCSTRAGDRILICSDGLTDMLSDEDVLGVLKGEKDCPRALAELVRRANAAGGKDNITILMIEFL